MSQSFNCHCAERAKPIAERNWAVVQRNTQCSAFSGYRTEYTKASTVVCGSCRAIGRTSANYVAALPDAAPDWWRSGSAKPNTSP